MVLWFALAIFINYSYKSKLTASLITSRAQEYDSIDQLVDKGYYFQVNKFVYLYILDIYKVIYKVFEEETSTLQEAINFVTSHHTG